MWQSGRVNPRRIIGRMTRVRKTAQGLGTPPPLQHWLHAVLLLCVSLAHHAASTLQMILVRCMRDWHTEASPDDLPRETSGTQLQDPAQAEPTGLFLATRPSALLSREGGEHGLRDARISLLSFRAEARSAADPEPRRHAHSLSSRKPQSGYPGPIYPRASSQNGSRLAPHPEPVEGRLAGMTNTA